MPGRIAPRRKPARRIEAQRTASSYAVFLDFDNTIAQSDVFDEMVKGFSVTPDWVALEEAWRAGRIGSKECLVGQLRGVRVTRQTLAAYLATVKLDPAFRRLVALLRRRGICPVILSDSFAFLIERVLKHHGVNGLPVYANHLRLIGDTLIPSFPYLDGCARCANCKARYLLEAKQQGRTVIYVGDGLSDVCAAKHADLLFAKDRLLAYCRKAGKPCVPFQSLRDVSTYLTTRVI